MVVLADDKRYSRLFLKWLGENPFARYMCSTHLNNADLFTFQIYGLEETDSKIFAHIKSNAGLVIITTKDNYPKLISIIKFYCDNISHIPILIVIENIVNNNDFNTIELINKSNVKYHNAYLREENMHWKDNKNPNSYDNLGWFNSEVIKFKPTIIPKNLLELEELVKQFVECTLSIENWSHLNRVRIVYFSLKNFGYTNTISQNGWLCVKWNKYKNTIGHSHLWNYTLTKFWVDRIFSLMLNHYHMGFAELYNKYSYLSDGNLHKKYYSNELIFSEKAKNEWVLPDLEYNN